MVPQIRTGQIFNVATQRELLVPTKEGEAGFVPQPEAPSEVAQAPGAPQAVEAPRPQSPLERLIAELKGRESPPRNKIAKLERQLREGRQSVPEGDEKLAGISKQENVQAQRGEVLGGFTTLLAPSGAERKAAEQAQLKLKLPSLGLPERGISEAIGRFLTKPGEVAGTRDIGLSEAFSRITGLQEQGPGKLNIRTPFGTFNVPEFGISEKFEETFGKVKNLLGSFRSRR